MSEEVSASGEVGQEAVSTATNETEVVTAVIEDKLRQKEVTTQQLITGLRRVETALRKNYPDPNRIVVPVSRGATIRQDFSRRVLIPNHVMFPRAAIVNGKPLKVGELKASKEGEVLPIYVAADGAGEPMRDSRGEYVVIDPQTGTLRQKLRSELTRRSVWRVLVARVRTWWRSWSFDFKLVKRNP